MKRVLYLVAIITLFKGFQALDDSDVTYYLVTHNNTNSSVQVGKNNITDYLEKDVEQLFFIVHGWLDSHLADWYSELTEAVLSEAETIYNVIQVDWSGPASDPYPIAVINVIEVVDIITDLILELHYNSTVNVSNVHIAGHSLGAQIAGFIGKNITKEIDLKLGRITGLDPAGPSYAGLPEAFRLAPTDAEVVLAIHTDALDYGLLDVSGTVDVYPNGGTAIQPGCPDLSIGDIDHCDHKRSYRYFTDALVHPGTLIARQCSNYAFYLIGGCRNNPKVDIGGKITSEDQGVYYLTTNLREPYGQS